MPSCVMRYCRNYSSKSSKSKGITYHSFPANEKRLIQWVDIIRKQRKEEEWKPNKSSKVCSIHFKAEDKYTSGKGLILLKTSAFPVLELPTAQRSPLCPNSLSETKVSDSELVFASPRKATIKKDVTRNMKEKGKTEKRIINKNEYVRKQIKRIQQHKVKLSDILKHLKWKKYISDEQFTELNQNNVTVNLFNTYYCKKRSNKLFRIKYPSALRKFALTLHFYSPSAYKYVRRVFCSTFPHPRVLGEWYENSSFSPGFTAQAFDLLKKISETSSKTLICTLVVEVMALRHQSKWTGKKTGVVDFCGTTDSKIIATEVHIFLVTALNDKWKLPVGYFFVKSISKDTRAHLINSCLRKSFESGVDIVAVSLDGSQVNFSAANILGCDFKDPNNLKTTFKHPCCDREVAVLFDPCHMLKLVRNTFESKRIIFNEFDKQIRWQYLVNLNNLQTSRSLIFNDKQYSEPHIKFRNEIIKVKLSTELLSKSVAKALELCEQLLVSTRFSDTSATVEFIEIFNDLFNMFSSRASVVLDYKKLSCARNATEILIFLEKAKQYLLSLKIYNKTKKTVNRRIILNITKKRIIECKCKWGFLGFLICIESLKHLFLSPIINQSLLYISNYPLSQDHIEILFGSIQNNRGNNHNNNPNVTEFKSMYKKILNHLELRSDFVSNCIPLENIPILNSCSAISNINWSSGKRVSIDDIEFESSELRGHEMQTDQTSKENVRKYSLLLNSEIMPSYFREMVGYISSWIAGEMVRILKCEVCIKSLFMTKKMWYHKLILINDMGGLCYSTESLFIICLKSENILKRHIKENGLRFNRQAEICVVKNRILKSFINSNVFSELNYHAMTQTPTLNHRMLLLKAIIEKYINVRLHLKHKNNAELYKQYQYGLQMY